MHTENINQTNIEDRTTWYDENSTEILISVLAFIVLIIIVFVVVKRNNQSSTTNKIPGINTNGQPQQPLSPNQHSNKTIEKEQGKQDEIKEIRMKPEDFNNLDENEKKICIKILDDIKLTEEYLELYVNKKEIENFHSETIQYDGSFFSGLLCLLNDTRYTLKDGTLYMPVISFLHTIIGKDNLINLALQVLNLTQKVL